MLKIFTILSLFLIFPIIASGQSTDPIGNSNLDGVELIGEPLLLNAENLTVVGFFPDVMPQFIEGGEIGLQDYLSKNIISKLSTNGIKKLVLVEIIISKLGTVTKTSILKGGTDTENQTIHSELRKMKFKPGLKGNHPTDVKIIIPIYF